jgi:tRNA pseudouridine55 synthase
MSGRRQKGLNIHGLLILDKPIGITSNRALQEVKHLFNARKAGHTGSLDPLATGMLPLCFGDATKFSQILLDAEKCYETTAKLGVITDSGDAEGNIIERQEVGNITAEKIELVLEKFRGKILQVPSMFSALKQKGRPLYELARQGIEVPREPRPITIYNLELKSFTADELSLSARVSKGTYIRSLVEDIGLALGCGAHVTALRRTTVSYFTEEKMISMKALKTLSEEKGADALQSLLEPVDALLQAMPTIQLNEKASFYLQRGQKVHVEGALETTEPGDVRLYDDHQNFIGVGVLQEDECVRAKRLIENSFP